MPPLRSTLRPPLASILLTFAAVMILVCAGCGPAPTPPPDPVTIRFARLEDSPERYEEWATAFHEAYPYITVELAPVGSFQLDNVDVALGSLYLLPAVQDQVGVLDLSAYVEADDAIDLDDYWPGAVELLTQNGQLVGLPSAVNLQVIYYNKDLFDLAGAPYPVAGWDWDDFVMTGVSLRSESDGTFGYVAADPVLESVTFLYQNGGWLADDLRNPTKATLDDPAVIDALQWYADLTQVYNLAPTADQLRAQPFSGIVEIGVIQSKVGMWMGWLNERGGAKTTNATWSVAWKFPYGIVPPPQRVRSGTLANVEGYYISAQSPHPEEAWRWIAFLSQQTPQWSLPARLSVLTSDDYERLAGAEVVALAQTMMATSELLPPNLFAFQPVLGAYGRAVQQVLGGYATAQEALEAAQGQVGDLR